MPLEFATAAYRFGHSMVRDNYNFNDTFRENGPEPKATIKQLFAFTGRGAIKNADFEVTLPNNWIIDWSHFFGSEAQTARKIDTQLARGLSEPPGMIKAAFDLLPAAAKATVPVAKDEFNAIMTHLAKRNLLRGYLLSMPTAQALASYVWLPTLSPADLLENTDETLAKHLANSGFLERTPLWYYILKEAEVTAGGHHLGLLGSSLVARTFLSLLMADPKSYLHIKMNDGETKRLWEPEDSVINPFIDKPI